MNKELYKEIFRRKSFHTFMERNDEHITDEEINDIYKAYNSFDTLNSDIKTTIRIDKKEKTGFTRSAEYSILMFSEKKDGYLQNIGYLGEQLDLYLVSKNIGSLWFGIAKSSEVYQGMNYIIQIGIAKVDTTKFRKDMFKAKRKEVSEIWDGKDYGIANTVRFAPSACNSQPWYVESNNDELLVYRKSKSGKVGIMPKNASVYFNQIDIGIFMWFLELCLDHENIKYERLLYKDKETFDTLELNAKYMIKNTTI